MGMKIIGCNGLLASGATVGATAQAQVSTTGVGVGSVTPAAKLHVAETVTTSPRGIMSSQHSTGTDGARFHMRKSRGTNATPTVIVTGDVLGRLVASGYDGTAYLEMGAIDIVSSGTIGTNRVPTEMRFLVATDAAPSVLTQRMVIDKAGNVGVGTANPATPLEVVGSIMISKTMGSTAYLSLFQAGVTDWLIANQATTGNLYFKPGGAKSIYWYYDAFNIGMALSAAGNVGIGTAAPTPALHLPPSSTARASLRVLAGAAPTSPPPKTAG